MSELVFDCLDVRADPHALAPTLLFDVRVADASGEPVQAILLRAQIRLEPQRRSYSTEEEGGLADLFGARGRWSETVKPLQFAATTAVVPAFTGSLTVTLPVACTYDIEVTTAKYLHALSDGMVPLLLLFSGTIFRPGPSGMQVEQVPWELEASYRMPVAVWDQLIALHFPQMGYLRLSTETLHALQAFKSRQMLTNWDEAFALLLDKAGEGG